MFAIEEESQSQAQSESHPAHHPCPLIRARGEDESSDDDEVFAIGIVNQQPQRDRDCNRRCRQRHEASGAAGPSRAGGANPEFGKEFEFEHDPEGELELELELEPELQPQAEGEQEPGGTDVTRMRVRMDTLEGYSAYILGEGINPHPAQFSLGLDGQYVPYTKKLFPDRQNAPRPVRALVVNVPIDDLRQDAERPEDFDSHDDEASQMRAVARATLLSMMSIGTSKGFTCGDHQEIRNAIEQGVEGEV